MARIRWFVLLSVGTLAVAASADVFDVRAFGAKGDGVTKDTAAIQKAVDACAAAGGGRVLLAGGVFRSGTVYLKSHVDFHVAAGARLFGSDSLDDYNALDAYPQNGTVVAREGWQHKHLLVCVEQEDVVLSGDGTVDANGSAFFDRTKEYCRGDINWRFGGFNAKDFEHAARPGPVVVFVECRDIRVRDLRFVDSSAWTCFFHGCENVQVRGIAVRNDIRDMNTDGVDIDSCRNVTVSDCLFETGDDGIAIRGAPRRLKDKTRVCENILVENCTARVSACGIRIGVGDGTIRHVTISNYIVQQAEFGICIQSAYSKMGAVDIGDVAVSNVSIRRSPYALWIQGDNGKRPRDIRFSNLQIFEDDTVPDRPMIHLRDADSVTFTDCRIGREDGVSRPLDLVKDISDLPHVRRAPARERNPVASGKWIDFNKNGRKDVYEDPSEPVERRVADLVGQIRANGAVPVRSEEFVRDKSPFRVVVGDREWDEKCAADPLLQQRDMGNFGPSLGGIRLFAL